VTANFSDRRLKENIQQIENAVEKIQNLSAIYYTPNKLARNYGHPNEKQIGLIAQQVKHSVPEVVKLAPFDSTGDENSLSGHNFLTIQYEKLVPVLVQAIKEQQLEISKLLQFVNDRSN
jgi:DNA modification methylase